MATETPKYERVKQSLIREIESGRWSAGEVMPSEAQLLQRFNVSRPTLVRSLQDLVREGYLFRRQGKGTFVAERVSRSGNGSSQRSLPIFNSRDTAVQAGSPSEVLLRLLRGAQSVLGPAHVDLAIRYVSGDGVDEETSGYLDKNEPGVALVVEPSFCKPLREELLRRGWTVWAVNEPWPEGNSVRIDQQRAGYLAARYLLEKGCRRVALLNGPVNDYWGFGARRDGYLAAHRELGLEPDLRLIREGSHVIDTEAGRAMMRSLLDEGLDVDGVVGASDSKAIGAIAVAQESGRRVPDDLAVVGIDDILASRSMPPLPSVTMPFDEVGRRAAEEALRTRTGDGSVPGAPVEIQLKPYLTER
jgi:GntR family transcriptional regulator of arabinose operon